MIFPNFETLKVNIKENMITGNPVANENIAGIKMPSENFKAKGISMPKNNTALKGQNAKANKIPKKKLPA